MNREIKFRGKQTKNGEWMYGIPFFWSNKMCDIQVEENGYLKVYRVDPNTVGQFTGLKDKNGKEIYEGDIMCLSDRGSHKEEVIVEHGLYGWTFYNPKTATFYSDGSHTYCAVENYRFMFGTGVCIGNIHDNPELLNTK